LKILPAKEFEALAVEQGYEILELPGGFIDQDTGESVVPEGTGTRIKTHEVGHEVLEHLPKSQKYYNPGKKDVLSMTESVTRTVDDEIEAEIYSYGVMDKKITPRVGMNALRVLVDRGWDLYPALSLVVGRLRHYGVYLSLKDRRDLIHIMERSHREEVPWKL